METILREFIEDSNYNSSNSCNIISSFDEETAKQYEKKVHFKENDDLKQEDYKPIEQSNKVEI